MLKYPATTNDRREAIITTPSDLKMKTLPNDSFPIRFRPCSAITPPEARPVSTRNAAGKDRILPCRSESDLWSTRAEQPVLRFRPYYRRLWRNDQLLSLRPRRGIAQRRRLAGQLLLRGQASVNPCVVTIGLLGYVANMVHVSAPPPIAGIRPASFPATVPTPITISGTNFGLNGVVEFCGAGLQSLSAPCHMTSTRSINITARLASVNHDRSARILDTTLMGTEMESRFR